jgi:creatinine amidohydrolase
MAVPKVERREKLMWGKNKRRDFLRTIGVSTLAAGIGGSDGLTAGTDAPVRATSLHGAGNKYVDPRKVLLYECTRKEIRESLLSGRLKAAIIPTGSTEQHNEHLAMIMDTGSALLISQHAALQVYPRAIVTTPVAIGVSPYWMNRYGTLTLRKEIFQAVVYDICTSLVTHGIRTILIVNGHGGNATPLREMMPEFRSKLEITLDICSYWESFSGVAATDYVESGNIPSHASEFETSIALAAFPQRVRYQGIDHDKAQLKISEQDRKGDKAAFEESKLATAEKGELIIAHAINWVTQKLVSMMG